LPNRLVGKFSTITTVSASADQSWLAYGGDAGSTIEPPDYQKLGGPWVNGKDPAGS